MPKYRYLNDEELKHLEEELKQFLVVNHVYKEEWEQINRENPDKALELVGLFSDNVLQTVYEKIRFLEKRTPGSCFVFHFTPEEIQLKVLQVENPGKADLSTPESIHEALLHHSNDLSFFKSSKKYSTSRETEIHQTLEQGAAVSTAGFWEMLEKLIP
ncbi:MAG: DUF6495 family protein [Bacteroidota bacterium]